MYQGQEVKRMNRKDILAVYEQGPEAVVSLIQGIIDTYEKRIQSHEVRIQELEFRTKKTPKTVIIHLPRMG